MMWDRVKALFVKELLAVWADPRSRMVLIVPPMIQLLVFAFAATQEVRNVSMAVLNQDRGVASRELVSRFEGSPTFTEIKWLTHEGEIRELIDSQSVMMALHIGPEFSRDITAGDPASVQIILDGRKSNATQILNGYAQQIVNRYGAEVARSAGAHSDAPGAPSTSLETRHWYNPNLEPQWFTVPGLLGILTMLVTVVVTSLSVAREREMGTFDQLLVSPYRPVEILIGKTAPALFIGVAEGTVILIAAVFAFNVPLTGSLLLLYFAMTIFISAIVGVGLFLSSLSATQQQAILGAFVFLVPCVLLSGFATPIENMPGWLQSVTLVNPLRHFLDIINGVFLKDMSAGLVLSFTWPMAAIAAVTLTAAAVLFTKRLD